jgi:hypothetical protein
MRLHSTGFPGAYGLNEDRGPSCLPNGGHWHDPFGCNPTRGPSFTETCNHCQGQRRSDLLPLPCIQKMQSLKAWSKAGVPLPS